MPSAPASAGTAKAASVGAASVSVVPPAAPSDPGFAGIHRLSNREYDNSVSDLVGTKLEAATGFLNETAYGFDNMAGSLGMTVAQYTAYYRVAETVARDAFVNADFKARAQCSQTSQDACVKQWISDLGLQAFRRPLSDAETGTYFKVYQIAIQQKLTTEAAQVQLLRAVLASGEFLYRLEFDTDPDSKTPHDLSGYELATRLSYFLWSSAPDSALLKAAKDGLLKSSQQVREQTDRMLKDPRSGELVGSFAWQWLGLKDLESHAVLSDVYPEWNEKLRDSMLEEARLYVSEFVQGKAPWSDMLSSGLHFVDGNLVKHYGLSQESDSKSFERRVAVFDDRVGFLGLSSFLTLSSFAHRTSPTLRAKWTLESLLCSPPPPPPPNLKIPDLDAAASANQAASIDNVRKRLELHRSDPSCASCHSYLDPLGLALENFDAIGRRRSKYTDGQAIDATGELPDGTKLAGLSDLSQVLKQDARFINCTAEKLFTYALGRKLTDPDEQTKGIVVGEWLKGSALFPDLVKQVVSSIPFRQRRGGGSGGAK
jgi:hypothetical protein